MNNRKNERGVSLVEFSIVLPFLVLLIIFTVDFCFLLGDYFALAHIVREGARQAAREMDVPTVRVRNNWSNETNSKLMKKMLLLAEERRRGARLSIIEYDEFGAIVDPLTQHARISPDGGFYITCLDGVRPVVRVEAETAYIPMFGRYFESVKWAPRFKYMVSHVVPYLRADACEFS